LDAAAPKKFKLNYSEVDPSNARMNRPPEPASRAAPTLARVTDGIDLRALRASEAQDDARLVAAALAGEEAAFARLVERYGQPILSLCITSTLDREEARDLAQEVFLAAWRNLASFRADATFSTWLFALARNTCIDAARRRAVRPTLARASDNATPASDLGTHSDPTIAAVFAVAARLPEPQREAFLLRDLQGLSYDEIAALQQVPVGTVRSRIAAARQTIADEVAR
jgi:RNA polymerase sigma-70 factor, ECF subfamily